MSRATLTLIPKRRMRIARRTKIRRKLVRRLRAQTPLRARNLPPTLPRKANLLNDRVLHWVQIRAAMSLLGTRRKRSLGLLPRVLAAVVPLLYLEDSLYGELDLRAMVRVQLARCPMEQEARVSDVRIWVPVRRVHLRDPGLAVLFLQGLGQPLLMLRRFGRP
jgi:hypothetical protein